MGIFLAFVHNVVESYSFEFFVRDRRPIIHLRLVDEVETFFQKNFFLQMESHAWKEINFNFYKSREGTRAETCLVPMFREKIKEQYTGAIVLAANQVPKSLRKTLFRKKTEMDLSPFLEIDEKNDPLCTRSQQTGIDVAIFLPSEKQTRYRIKDQYYAFIPGEIKINPELLSNSGTRNEMNEVWRKDKDRWGDYEPQVFLCTIDPDMKTVDGDDIPFEVWTKLKPNPCSETVRKSLNLKTFVIPFQFQHPSKVLGSSGDNTTDNTTTSKKKLSDLKKPFPWIRDALCQTLTMVRNGHRVIGVNSHIGTGKAAFIAKLLKDSIRSVGASIGVFPTIPVLQDCTNKYDVNGDLKEVDHKTTNINNYFSFFKSKARESNEKLPSFCICKATLKTKWIQ